VKAERIPKDARMTRLLRGWSPILERRRVSMLLMFGKYLYGKGPSTQHLSHYIQMDL
jgi:hypothetical protein